MSGTVTARDSWLLTVISPSSSFPQEPPQCGSPVSRDVLTFSVQQRRALDCKPLSYFHVPGQHGEAPGEQKSKPFCVSPLSRLRTKPW